MTNPKMPISIAFSAFFFNLINVSIQAFGIFYFTEYSENWISNPTFIIGLSIFLLGMFINIKSDYIIMEMKKKKGCMLCGASNTPQIDVNTASVITLGFSKERKSPTELSFELSI